MNSQVFGVRHSNGQLNSTTTPGRVHADRQAASDLTRTAPPLQLDDWLVPRGCILPPPITIFPPLISCWERQSQKLAVNSGAQDAFE